MLAAKGNRSGIACLLALAFCGCETPRWSNQWATFAPIRAPTQLESPELPSRSANVQVFGINGYRFGTAGASVTVEVPTAAIGWDSLTYRVVPVRLAGASDGLDGYVFTDLAGRSFLSAKLTRLTVREWKEQPLLLETVVPSGYGLLLSPNEIAFDLDLGQNVILPSGAATYQCVSAQARNLANTEIIRAASDRGKGRITAKELEYVHEKVVGLLASSADTCR